MDIYIFLSAFCLSLLHSLNCPPFHSPSCSLCTSVKCTQSVEELPDGVTPNADQLQFFFHPFSQLLFLIPLASILPFYYSTAALILQPPPPLSPWRMSVLLEAMYQSQLNCFLIVSISAIIFIYHLKRKWQWQPSISACRCLVILCSRKNFWTLVSWRGNKMWPVGSAACQGHVSPS